MRIAGITLLLIGLAGCTTSGSWFQREDEAPPAPMANTAAPPQSAPQQAAPRGAPSNMSPAATAAAPSEATTGSGGELLDCVTESCKINCSAKVKKQFQPKWCARFKEPE